MILSKRVKLMLDRTTIEFHLINYTFCIGHDTVGILTVETVEPLSPGEFPELVSIEDDIFFSVNKRYLHDTEIDVLELPQKTIQYEERYDT